MVQGRGVANRARERLVGWWRFCQWERRRTSLCLTQYCLQLMRAVLRAWREALPVVEQRRARRPARPPWPLNGPPGRPVMQL